MTKNFGRWSTALLAGAWMTLKIRPSPTYYLPNVFVLGQTYERNYEDSLEKKLPPRVPSFQVA